MYRNVENGVEDYWGRVFQGVLITATVLCFVYSSYLALRYAQQVLLDLHSFRQTQTALSVYWFVQEGFKLAYETPIGGAPWSIPFEFPIYQIIVAFLSTSLGASIDAVGRVTSYVFLLLTIASVYKINKILKLPRAVFLCFFALTLSMPLYVYWARTVMIETTALFFAAASILFFLQYFFIKRSVVTGLLFVVFSSLVILQKVTTGLPILGVLFVLFMVREWKSFRQNPAHRFGGSQIVVVCCFALPIILGYAWVQFSDGVKIRNEFGKHLTSAALSWWNWGTLQQRLSAEIWRRLLWERLLVPNAGGLLGLFLLALPFAAKVDPRVRRIFFVSLAMGFLPFLLFTNLHNIHDYYQTANVIFIGYALSIVLGCIVPVGYGAVPAVVAFVIIVASNFLVVQANYVPKMETVYGKETREVAVGEVLKRELPVANQFVAFGNDWNSSFAYLAQRKSFTVPPWFSQYNNVVSSPESYVEEGRLGGLVSCLSENPSLSDILSWSENGRAWKVGETNGCFIATPAKELAVSTLKQVSCEGDIDKLEIMNVNGQTVISIGGWSVLPGQKKIPDGWFIAISSTDGKTKYLEALKVPRLDVSSRLGLSSDGDAGFSRIFRSSFSPGDYDVQLVQHSHDEYESCQFKKRLSITN